MTPLSLACTNGNAAMVELLLDAGADPNTALPGGETALMTAARTGKVEAVKALLSRGADVNAKESGRGQTALMWAAAEGHAEVVEALLTAGADFRARLDSGFTPLLFAVREGRIDVVRALLKAGADVNEIIESPARPPRGGRPPAMARARCCLAVDERALRAGGAAAGGGRRSQRRRDRLHGAARDRASCASRASATTIRRLRGSGTMTSLELVKKLAAHGANVNARMTKKVNLSNTRLNKLGATPFLPGGADGGRRADAHAGSNWAPIRC